MPASCAARGVRGAEVASPGSSIEPASGACTPLRILTSVLLPEPFSPTSACTSPARSSNDASRTACVAPNAFATLVSDAQDGYPGIRGIGPSTAAALLNRHGPIESFPDGVLGTDRERALLFKRLATLRNDAPLFADVEELEWRGPTAAFAEWPERMADARIQARCVNARASRKPTALPM